MINRIRTIFIRKLQSIKSKIALKIAIKTTESDKGVSTINEFILLEAMGDASLNTSTAIIVIKKALSIIKETDPLKYKLVCKSVDYILLIDRFNKEFNYDVYVKTLYVNLPIKGYEKDPKSFCEKTACYIVERAVFSRIFWNTHAIENKEQHSRVSDVLFNSREKFANKIRKEKDKGHPK